MLNGREGKIEVTAPEYKGRFRSFAGATVAICMVVSGIAARIGIYLHDLPVNHDEGLLYLAQQRWTPEKWLTPLGFEQTAGPLYLAILHAVANRGPHAEFFYRFPSFFISILTLPVFYLSVRILRPGVTALIATSLLSLHSGLVNYSGMFKQYETDVFIAALVFGLAAIIKGRSLGLSTWWVVWLLGCLGILTSQPAIVMLFCLLVWSFLSPEVDNSPRWIAVCALSWLTLEGILYFRLYAPVAASPYMRSFWSDSYLSAVSASGWWNAIRALFGDGLGGTIPCLVLTLVGSIVLARKQRSLLILAGGPILSAIALAILHMYPVAARLWMFLVPSATLAAAVAVGFIGTQTVRALPGYRVPVIGLALLLVAAVTVVLSPDRAQFLRTVFPAIRTLRFAYTAQQGRRAVENLLQGKSCDPVYIAARSVPSWYFYTRSGATGGSLRYAFLESALKRDSPAFGDAPPSALHLPDLAPQLDFHAGCRVEIYGLASGTPFRNGLPQEGRAPVPGWAGNEIDRVTAPGTSGFYLYLDQLRGFEPQSLMNELSARHLRYQAPDPAFPLYRIQKN